AACGHHLCSRAEKSQRPSVVEVARAGDVASPPLTQWYRRWLLFFPLLLTGQTELPLAKPIPRVQAVPEPYDQISFQVDGKELARYHFHASLHRPFVYPVLGPSGRTLTRMGHPGDPFTHSHHNSVWISYSNVNGVDYWTDH